MGQPAGHGRGEEMNQKQLRTSLGHPTPELPVEDVDRAQQHYRDSLGFDIGWLYPGGGIGAVSRDTFAIFFRGVAGHLSPRFTGSLRPISTQRTRNCARAAHESLNLLRRSPGVCASSRWKISMETASIFTATDGGLFTVGWPTLNAPGFGAIGWVACSFCFAPRVLRPT